MSASCSNPSQHIAESIEEDVPPPPPNKKYSIIVEMDGAKGKDSSKWASRCGVLIRRHIPINYDDWRKVDMFYKNNLWKALMKEFELNINPDVARPILEQFFPQYFRTAKAKLRKTYIKTKEKEFLPRHLAIENRPDDIDKVQWEGFIDNEYTDKKKKQCKTNSDNKAKNTINHTLGRKSYARLYEELEAEDPNSKVSRTKAWKVAHTSKKTGDVIPCAAEKYALIEAVEERQKSESSVNGGDGIRSLEEFERDPVAEVFGDDRKRSYCRAISSTANVKKVKLAQASKAILNYQESGNQQWRTEMQNQHNQMYEEIKTMSSAIIDMKQCMQLLVNQIGGNVSTSRPEDVSNTEQNNENINNPGSSKSASLDRGPSKSASLDRGPSKSASLDKGTRSSTREKQSVKLLAPDLKEVAKGHIGTQKMCHGRKVVEGEQVVWIEDVIDPEASLFDAQQNGHYTLSELVDGGFVIWPEYRLRYQ